MASPKRGHNKGKIGGEHDKAREDRGCGGGRKWQAWENAWEDHAELRVAAAAQGETVLCVSAEMIDQYGWRQPQGEMKEFRKLLDGFALAHDSFDVEFCINGEGWRRFQAARASGQKVRPEDVIAVVKADKPCSAHDYKHTVKTGKVFQGWDARD